MSKRKPKARKVDIATTTAAPAEKRNWITRISTLWRLILFLVGIPGLYGGILSVLPRVSVSPSEELKKYDPLSSPFVIANDRFLSIYSVNMACTVDHLLLSNGTRIVGASIREDLTDDEIGPDGRTTRFCKITTPDPKMKEAIITTTVRFRPEFLPWTTTRAFRLRGYPSDDGVMHWSPYTPDKNWV
jgi:hypothetical protein